MSYNFLKTNNILFLLIKLSIATIVLYYVSKYTNLTINDHLKLFFFNSNLLIIIIFFLCYYILSVYRWFIITRKLGIRTKFIECFKIDSSSIIANFLVPAGELSGEATRGFLLYKKYPNKTKILMSLIIDRGIGLIILLILSLPSFVYLFFIKFQISWIFLIFIILFTMVLIKFFFKKILNFCIIKFKLKKYFTLFIKVLKSLKFLISISTLSIIFFYLVVIFGGNIDIHNMNLLWKTILVFPLGLIVMSLPITPAGIGIGSLAYLTLFNFFFSELNYVLVNGILIYQLLFFCLGVFVFLLNIILYKNYSQTK